MSHMGTARSFQAQVLLVRCPKCGAGVSHWCRDEHGKCVSAHRERRMETIRLSVAPFCVGKNRGDAA